MKRVTLICMASLLVMVVLLGLGGLGAESGQVVFRYAVPWEEMTCDPQGMFDIPTSIPVYNAYEPLMMPVKGEAAIPWVAESYTSSKDMLTYIFGIRRGIKFHDGTELTAEDVAFSMDRMLTMRLGYSYVWEGILEPGDTEAVGDYTVVFHLRESFAPFVGTLILLFIANEDLCMENKKPGDFGEFGDYGQEYLTTHDAGSGPYIVENMQLGSSYTLAKFQDYWKGWQENSIDRVEVQVVIEEATRMMMFKRGELDMTDETLPQIPEMRAELEGIDGVTVVEDPMLRLWIIQMHNQKPPLDDVNVRKAISYAFDYEAIRDEVMGGGVLARGPVPVLMPGHSSDATQYYKDLELARSFLSKSKYSMEELQKMELVYSYIAGFEVERLWGLVLADSLAALGLNVKLDAIPTATLVEICTTQETSTHFMAFWITARYAHPHMYTYGMYHPDSWGVHLSSSWYENPTASEVLEKARKALDNEEGFELYREAQSIITADAASLWLLNPPQLYAYWDWVKGYSFTGPMAYELRFSNFSIVGRE